MSAIETIRFRNDTATRKRLMVPEAFAHLWGYSRKARGTL